MPETQSVASARGRLAGSKRWHPEKDNADLRRDLAAAKLEAYVEKVISDAPPLSPEQIDRVAVLLRGGSK